METDNFKKVNEKRYKNKQRYKKHIGKDETTTNITTKNKIPVKKVSEETLASNWSKYEISSSDEENIYEKANFETLLDKPTSQASYFKFKNEEDWAKNVEIHSQFQKYFTLDINMLNAGIACVKFSERHSYNDEILKSLDDSTDKAQTKYEAYLNKISNTSLLSMKKSDEKINYLQEKLSEQKLTESVQKMVAKDDQLLTTDNKINTIVNNACDDEDIDGLMQDSTEEEIKECIVEDPLMATTVQHKNISKTLNTGEDLEDWLDDILDD